MSDAGGFEQKLDKVSRLWEKQRYDAALAEVEGMLRTRPGNAACTSSGRAWCNLREPRPPSRRRRDRRQGQAVELDLDRRRRRSSWVHYLDNVEDDPQAAAKSYADGVAAARRPAARRAARPGEGACSSWAGGKSFPLPA
ncbi:MAG: hypothetical protein U0736_15915 [Gemmataceae bacterium]